MKMTLAQYAEARGVSLQAVSGVFRRHKDEMAGKYLKEGKRAATVLTAEGIAYMDSVRRRQTIEVIDDGAADKVKQLEQQIAELRAEKDKLQRDLEEQRANLQARNDDLTDRLLKSYDQLITIQAQNNELLLEMKQEKAQKEVQPDTKKGIWGWFKRKN